MRSRDLVLALVLALALALVLYLVLVLVQVLVRAAQLRCARTRMVLCVNLCQSGSSSHL